MNLLIRNGRIIDSSQGIDRFGDVLIADGKIAQIGDSITALPEGCTVLDAAGMVVCPGFVDLHCHLREPGFEEKETIATGTAAAARGGFTTVCCMPNTEPPIATPEMVRQILNIAEREGAVRVLPIGAITEGRKGARLAGLTTLHKAGAVAFSDDGSPVFEAKIMSLALDYSRLLNVPIIDHCEDTGLSQGGSMNEGSLSVWLGFKGISPVAEECMVERDIELAKKTGGWIHIAHASTAVSVDLIRQGKRQGVRVTAEATPHHLTLTEEMVATVGTAAKVNPPLRTEQDREALVEGLNDGTIDIIATDHAPHTQADKDCHFERAAFGISGFETALGSLMGLVHRGEIALPTLISKLTAEPARILGIAEIGNMRAGSEADITVFDPHAEWIVDPQKFASKGRNTPLAGETLRGKIFATVLAGKIIYQSL